MIRLQDVAASFAGRELYHDVNLFIGPESRIGLVGPNGSGKTTLFRLITRELEPDQGSVEVQRDLRIAHLPQTGVVLQERAVLPEVLSVFADLGRVETELEQLEPRLNRPTEKAHELPELLNRYARLREERDHLGYAHEAQAKTLLTELGFAEEDFARPTSFASGGFQVRIALAKLLLSDPDVLLLDEPTNYLDIGAIAWLEDYLRSFRGAFVLVTHDRYLLDACVNRVWAIEKPTVVTWKDNFSGYCAAKAQRDAQLEKAAELQQKKIEKTQRFIERFRARKDAARRVKSREKALAKLERIVLPEKRKRIRFRFPEAATIYGQAVTLQGISQGFGARPVLADVSLTVAGGERIGLFGANGEGKTTLLRIISGELKPTSGKVWHSGKLKVAFYHQGAEELLNPGLTVIEEAQKEAEGYTLLELRTILGAFLFSGDDVYKRVSVLSGGEKTRLALIKVLLRASNLLLLDEPTNHLDIESREVLEEAISDYRNTVVFAAHDRFMIDRLASKTVAVRAGRADVFPGNYTYATSGRSGPVSPGPAAPAVPELVAPMIQPEPTRAVAPQRPESCRPRPPPAPDPAAKLRARIRQREERLRQLETEYEAAKQRLDFSRAREIWTERQILIDELLALRNQE
jgi:ATP-binding cassette subfamily F protein 3